jgi:hypothetical protein
LKVFGYITELENGRQAVIDDPEITSIFMHFLTSQEDEKISHATKVLAQLGNCFLPK